MSPSPYSSIQISGANAPDFRESDNCISSPVLPTNHTCTISVTYAPTAVGTSQATLLITDNAPGSPQSVPLSGTTSAPPPPGPPVTLNPATNLNFPGTPTQGTSTLPQNVTLTSSSTTPLQITSAVLSGFNVADFSISANTRSGTLAANASCTVSMIFSPLASGIRNTSLIFTDSASTSPQTINVNGTALPAANFTAAPSGGSLTASVSAGQTAQFNLQAMPGTGFTGVLNFTCSGVPTGATCSVPANVSVANGVATSFTVSVSTSGSAAVFPPPSPRFPPLVTPLFVATILFAGFVFLLAQLQRNPLAPVRRAAWPVAFAALLLLTCLNGCGGGSSASPTPPPPIVTPACTYTISVTPLATATGSTKQLQLDLISLQLTVK